jgi:hypothetical protein
MTPLEALAQPAEQPTEPAGEPVAWDVYVAEHQHGYLIDSLEDPQYLDDATNHGAVVTPLYTRPAVPLTDEREAFVLWLSATYPRTFTVEDAEHKWKHEHVAALAWKKRATLAHKIGGTP